MKVAFIAAGPIEFASSRMRAYWVAKHMEGAIVQRFDDIIRSEKIVNADAYVFQKSIDPSIVKQAQDRGAQVWWDVCDPSWWWQPDMVERLDMVDGVVASNQALADDWEKYSGKPAHVIPDRLDLTHFDKQREHHDRSPVRFIWYGLYCNRVAIAAAWVNLVRVQALGHPVTLTIMDNKPTESWMGVLGAEIPIAYVPWQLSKEVEIIASHDVALLPPYPGPWGKVKSHNKWTTAWACGVPITEGALKSIKRFCKVKERIGAGRLFRKSVENSYNVTQSAADWQELLGC